MQKLVSTISPQTFDTVTLSCLAIRNPIDGCQQSSPLKTHKRSENLRFINPSLAKNAHDHTSHVCLFTYCCIKTIRTAAYAAVAATTSNDLLGIVINIDTVKRHINPVITASLLVLLEI